MRPLAATAVLVVLIALAGCATVQVNQDYDPRADFSGYATWQWRDPVQPSTGDIRADNPLMDKRIRRAVENHLFSRFLNQAEDRPDFYLAYHLAIEPRIQSDRFHTTLEVGPYYHPGYGGFGTETRIRQYDESRLTIDIHSADTGDLVWRGVGTYRLKTYKTPQQADAAAQARVDKILLQFPPTARQ